MDSSGFMHIIDTPQGVVKVGGKKKGRDENGEAEEHKKRGPVRDGEMKIIGKEERRRRVRELMLKERVNLLGGIQYNGTFFMLCRCYDSPTPKHFLQKITVETWLAIIQTCHILCSS